MMKLVISPPAWRQYLWRWLPMLLWMAAIFVVSHRPSSDLPGFGLWDLLVKKSGHFLAYALLAILAYRVTADTRRPYLFALLITILYAASDELHQTFVDSRNGNVIDVLIDSGGGMTGLYLYYRWTLSQRLARSVKTPIEKSVKE